MGWLDDDTTISNGMNDNRTHQTALFRRSSDPIVAAQFDGRGWRIEETNISFERFLERRPDLSGDTAESDLLGRLDGNGRVTREPVRRLTNDGFRMFRLEAIGRTSNDRLSGAYIRYIDVTERHRLRQQTDVLNRVLRHDLRNDLNVITGYAELLEDAVTDPDASRLVGKIRAASENLGEIGRTAREVQITEARDEPGELRLIVTQVRSKIRELTDDAPVHVSIPERRILVDGRLEPALLGLYRHICDHCGDTLETHIEAELQGDLLELELRIDCEEIPTEELQPLNGESETPLRHATGLGLWVFYWGVTAIGGVTAAENGSDHCTITARFPVESSG